MNMNKDKSNLKERIDKAGLYAKVWNVIHIDFNEPLKNFRAKV